ncbi:F-box protein At3g59000-like [Papaver somniferum]|uniref:F-box protein At3g59000-like n=1 Tax=Papaver somniferum TaxID=3469 RepID=UPI000E704C17|nr:F-box protein At3g59000-like [Papaver somniferum]
MPPIQEHRSTCVLAKRWRFEWSSVPNLDIGHWRSPINTTRTNISEETIRFMNFMDRVFMFRDMSNIGKFSLSCDKHCDEDRVRSWLSVVVRRNVKEFSLLSEDERDSFMIHLLLYTCETLTMLKIEMPIYLNILTNVHLPNLKIDIDAPSLEVFQHKGTLAEVYDLHSFPSLIDANISLFDINDWIDEDENIATNLLALCRVDDDELLSVHNLTCFEVVWSSPDLIGSALMRLLQISPKLEKLVFSHGIDARLCGEDNGWKPATLPECLLSHLRFLEVYLCPRESNEIAHSLGKDARLRNDPILWTLVLSNWLSSLVNEIKEKLDVVSF